MDTRLMIRPGREVNITIYKNPNSDATAFLFHGLGGRWDQWQDQIPALKDKYTLIIPHLYGHEKSDKPKPSISNNPYSFLEFNQDMHIIFDRFKSKKNIVLGHSYGGALATTLALDRQDEIQQLILIDPMILKTQQTVPLIYLFPVFILKILQPLLDKLYRKLSFDPHTNPALIKEEVDAARRNEMVVIKAMITGMKTIPEVHLNQLKIPTLIIIGETDKLILPEKMREFYKAIPNHQFQMIKDASHMVLREKPLETNRVIIDFLTALPK